MTEPGRRRTRAERDAGVTIEQVARQADVSVATVSRALRGLPNVAPSTRARVELVARELHYQVDPYASRLAKGTNDTVGIVVPDIDTWYFSLVAAGVEAVMAEAGRDVLLYAVRDSMQRKRLLSQAAASRRRLDGLILIDVLLSQTEQEVLSSEGVRVVTVGQRTDRFPSVTVDNRGASEMAVQHLINMGHTDIAIIGADTAGTPLPFDVPDQRRGGYLDALARAGIAFRPELDVPGNFTLRGGIEAMTHLLTTSRPPTAVFALSDTMALGAVKTLKDLGYSVPGDVSVVGFDDHELSSVSELTTVHQEPTWHGASAARLLLASQNDAKAKPRHVVAPTRLVVRATTGPRDS